MKLRSICEEWTKPDLRGEADELRRTATDLGLDPTVLLKAAVAGRLQPLNERDWSRLQNSDSYQVMDIAAAKQLAIEYGRDIDKIIEGIKRGDKLPAAIVLTTKNGPYLVAGNTRLMVARAMEMRPLVWVIDPSIDESFLSQKIRDAMSSKNFFNHAAIGQNDQPYEPSTGMEGNVTDKPTPQSDKVPAKPRHRRYFGMERRPGTIRL